MYSIETFQTELEQLSQRLQETQLLSKERLGNDIPFWIFHYPPEYELFVRAYFPRIEKGLRGKDVLHLNIFQVLIEMLEKDNLLSRLESVEQKLGSSKVREVLAVSLSQDRIANYLAQHYQLQEQDLVMISGIGMAWPLLRGHELLSALQDVMGATPMILFYPGNYDGHALTPFGKVASNNYYRAFILNSLIG